MQSQAATDSTQPPTQIPDQTANLPHGGQLTAARRQFPGAPEPFIDLSTGINPIAYPLPGLPPDLWHRLPELETLATLQRAASTAYRVADPAMVVAAPGTQILISLLPHLLQHDAATILAPTYGEHRAAWHNAGAQTQEVSTPADLPNSGAVILCNPNNPDGRRIDPASLLTLADALSHRGGILIVDEAFADFDPALSIAPALPHPALLVLRSFGKAYGLAGLRLGFALTAPALAHRLRTALGPWAVSGPAATIGTVALANEPWRREAAARLTRDATRLDALLETAGLEIRGGTTLFRLASSLIAPALFDRLGAAGILVRRFDANPTWLRFGLPADQPAWDRLEKTLRT
jgi:cobalamin biosynthetic protein CobC